MSIDIGLRVRTEQMRQALGQIPGMTKQETNKAVTAAAREWKKLPKAAQQAAKQSSAQMAKISNSIGMISPAAGRATAAVQSLGGALGPGMAAALGPIALVAAALSALGAASFASANRMSKIVDEANNTAEAVGVSTRTFLALQSAVAETGADMAKTQQALASFTRVMDLTGKSAAEVDYELLQTLKRLEAIESPAERAAERMRIFGTRSAAAVAALSSDKLEKARQNTNELATAIEAAGKSSTEMDRANNALRTSIETLTVKLGDEFAPAVVEITEAITKFTDALGSSVKALSWYYRQSTWVIRGVVGLVGELAKSGKTVGEVYGGAAAGIEETAEAARKLREAMEGSGVGSMLDGLIEEEKKRKAWAEERARTAEAEERLYQQQLDSLSRMRKEIRSASADMADPLGALDIRMELELDQLHDWLESVGMIPDAIELAEERRLQIERKYAQAREEIRIAESEAIKSEQLRRIEELAAAERELQLQRINNTATTLDGITRVADAVAGQSKALAAIRLGEAIANQAVAITRAFAEGGPIAGPALAASVVGALAGPIADVARVAGGGGGSRGGFGGSFGDLRSRDLRGSGNQGGLDRQASGFFFEYRSELFDAQSSDALRRPGAPLRDVLRARRLNR